MDDSAFRWNDWNTEHIATHGISPEEAEDLVTAAHRPYPEYVGDGKWRVRGQTKAGRYLQFIFIVEDDRYYVIHARGLSDREKRQLRRRRK